jgi:hypothetical protein
VLLKTIRHCLAVCTRASSRSEGPPPGASQLRWQMDIEPLEAAVCLWRVQIAAGDSPISIGGQLTWRLCLLSTRRNVEGDMRRRPGRAYWLLKVWLFYGQLHHRTDQAGCSSSGMQRWKHRALFIQSFYYKTSLYEPLANVPHTRLNPDMTECIPCGKLDLASSTCCHLTTPFHVPGSVDCYTRVPGYIHKSAHCAP